jgi:type IX secretion system PorP/SprF family membrane protein
MKRKNTVFVGLLVLCFSLSNTKMAQGQDLHFSQFYSTLTNINPGATGAFGGDIRFLSNYRSQWNSINQPFTTTYASLDLGMFKYKGDGEQGSFPAVGISFLKDKAGAGDLTLTEIDLSIAYNLRMGRQNIISVGLRAGNARRTIDFGAFTWDSQFDPATGSLNAAGPNGEPIRNEQFSYLPISMGLLWNFTIPDRFRFNLGLAKNGMNEPSAQFTKSGDSDKLNAQTVIHSSSEVLFNNTDLSLLPHFLYINQGESREFTAGLMMKYAVSFDSKYTGLKKSSGIYAGAFIRSNDAIVLASRIDFKNNFSVGFSYDFDTTPLKDVTGRTGGIEVMLLYSGFFKKETHLPRKGSPQFL